MRLFVQWIDVWMRYMIIDGTGAGGVVIVSTLIPLSSFLSNQPAGQRYQVAYRLES